jgi:hypothetical protein
MSSYKCTRYQTEFEGFKRWFINKSHIEPLPIYNLSCKVCHAEFGTRPIRQCVCRRPPAAFEFYTRLHSAIGLLWSLDYGCLCHISDCPY